MRKKRRSMASLMVALTAALVAFACQDSSTARPVPDQRPQAIAPVPPEQAAFEKQLTGLSQEGWYGIYMMGKKVGHGHLWFRGSRVGEAGAYTYGFEMKMSVSGGGQANELTLSENRFYGAQYPHPLIETRFTTGARGFDDVRSAVPTPTGQMRITRTLGGKVEPERLLAGTKEDLIAQLRMSPLELVDAEIGTSAKVSLWTWEKEADEVISVTFDAIDQRRRAGVAERVGRFTIIYEATGVKGSVLVGGGGMMLEMTLGSSLLMKLEERSVAESGIAGLDILGTGIASPVKLGRPDRITALVLEISGPKELALAPSSVRKVEPLPVGADAVRARWRLTLESGPGDLVTAAERSAALVADATVDSGHPAIVTRARELSAGLGSQGDKARAIADWVFRTLDKKLATHLPTASTVLDQKVGDCTEHTWLTVALLRAAGIPARPVYGVAYTGDGEAVFAYHAWVEVALPDGAAPDGERWLAIDPTWGEAAADATHIALGATLGEVAGSIGGLTIERAEVRTGR